MEKKKTPPVKEAKGNKLDEALATLAKIAAANKAKYTKLNKAGMIAVALLMFGAYHFQIAGHAVGTCALYWFANDGVISGRQDGSVKMRNGVERKMVIPRLVQNAFTTGARALMSAYSSLWASLSQSDQNSWLNVTNVFKSNRAGKQISIKGKSLFIERNVNLVNVGVAPITTYVPSEGIIGAIISAISITSGGGNISALTVGFNPTPTDASTEVKVFATAPQGSGINRPAPSQYRLITVMPNGTATPFNIFAAYSAKFGTAAVGGQKIFIRFQAVNNVTGAMGVVNDFMGVV